MHFSIPFLVCVSIFYLWYRSSFCYI